MTYTKRFVKTQEGLQEATQRPAASTGGMVFGINADPSTESHVLYRGEIVDTGSYAGAIQSAVFTLDVVVPGETSEDHLIEVDGLYMQLDAYIQVTKEASSDTSFFLLEAYELVDFGDGLEKDIIDKSNMCYSNMTTGHVQDLTTLKKENGDPWSENYTTNTLHSYGKLLGNRFVLPGTSHTYYVEVLNRGSLPGSPTAIMHGSVILYAY